MPKHNKGTTQGARESVAFKTWFIIRLERRDEGEKAVFDVQTQSVDGSGRASVLMKMNIL